MKGKSKLSKLKLRLKKRHKTSCAATKDKTTGARNNKDLPPPPPPPPPPKSPGFVQDSVSVLSDKNNVKPAPIAETSVDETVSGPEKGLASKRKAEPGQSQPESSTTSNKRIVVKLKLNKAVPENQN